MSKPLELSKASKLDLTKDLVSSFLQGECGKTVKASDLADLFNEVYEGIDAKYP